MGDFKTWLESNDSQRISSVEEAKAASQSSGLSTEGIEFNVIQKALDSRMPITYETNFPVVGLGGVPAGDKGKLIQMLGAFAQRMGVDPPESLEDAQSLKIRDPKFREMTPPIIVFKRGGKVNVVDGVSRVTAAKLLRVWEIRAFVIG